MADQDPITQEDLRNLGFALYTAGCWTEGSLARAFIKIGQEIIDFVDGMNGEADD
jgi:hypothetical protein